MRRIVAMLVTTAMAAGLFVLGPLATPAHAASFSNSTAITIPDPNCTDPDTASPYPSTIAVTGLSGTITDVNITLNGVSHPFEGDLEMLLVSPAGTNLEFLSDAGTGALTNANVTFDDAAANALPQNSAWGAGTYKPTNYTEISGADTFPAPAPAPSANTTLAAFNGGSPNGTWSLYITDDACPDAGSVGGGWSLDITTNAAAAATTTAVISSQNPSTTGQSVTFTATVTSNATPVTAGTVTFTDGATTLSPNVPVDSNGQAAYTSTSLTEGDHHVVATYNGTATFGTSNGAVDQRVDNATTVVSNAYCNTGPITINDNTTATPYGSLITVSGQPVNLDKVTVTLKNISHAFSGDIDALLVGPQGENLVLVSDSGTAAASGVTLTFDDAAASSLPENGSWSSNTYKPSDYTELTADSFPAPAPTPTTATTLATFNDTNPNGAWRLYVVDDSGGDAGTIAGGWCLTVTASAPPNPVTITTTPSPGGRFGISVNDTATLSGGSSPTGTVTFNLFSDATCATQVFTDTATLASGSATSANYTPTSPGTYYWQATYNGDSNNAAVGPTTCGDEIVGIAPPKPTLTTTPSASVPVGGALSDVAVVSGGGATPTGDVIFQLYDDNRCTNLLLTSQKTLSGGSATSSSYTTTHPGMYYWRIRYLGDANYAPTGDACGDEHTYVTKATPSVSTVASAGGPRRTTAVRDTATITGGYNPAGQVRFRLYSDASCTTVVFTSIANISGGTATSADYTPTKPGTYYWAVKYLGDANNFDTPQTCGGPNETVTIT